MSSPSAHALPLISPWILPILFPLGSSYPAAFGLQITNMTEAASLFLPEKDEKKTFLLGGRKVRRQITLDNNSNWQSQKKVKS